MIPLRDFQSRIGALAGFSDVNSLSQGSFPLWRKEKKKEKKRNGTSNFQLCTNGFIQLKKEAREDDTAHFLPILSFVIISNVLLSWYALHKYTLEKFKGIWDSVKYACLATNINILRNIIYNIHFFAGKKNIGFDPSRPMDKRLLSRSRWARIGNIGSQGSQVVSYSLLHAPSIVWCNANTRTWQSWEIRSLKIKKKKRRRRN